jgi:hypothetical protein
MGWMGAISEKICFARCALSEGSASEAGSSGGDDDFTLNPTLCLRKYEFCNCALSPSKEELSFADGYAAAQCV